MVVEIQLLTGSRERRFVSAPVAQAMVRAGFARIDLGDTMSRISGDLVTPSGLSNEKILGPSTASRAPTNPVPVQAPVRPPVVLDAVDPVTGFDEDVEQFELTMPKIPPPPRTWVGKPKLTLPPRGVPVKTDPLSGQGETVSTGAPATVMGGVLHYDQDYVKQFTRLPTDGEQTVSAPRGGPDDISVLPGRYPTPDYNPPVRHTDPIPVSGATRPLPSIGRIARNTVPIALNVACRVLTRGRMRASHSKALCALIRAGLRRCTQ